MGESVTLEMVYREVRSIRGMLEKVRKGEYVALEEAEKKLGFTRI
ncbi:hypothetical protein [Candidatus Hecatella orcuttiae]|nr:hypothetical protein [Candidatus Hecatella orcuttiae]